MDLPSSLTAMLDGYVPEPEEPAAKAPAASRQGRLDIQTERKGRRGKTVVIVSGFTIDDDEIAALAADLKKRLGTGGSAVDGTILMQGDRARDVLDALTAMGYKARII